MRHFFVIGLTIFFSLGSLSSHGQTWGDSTMKKMDIFYSVQTPPKFPGGQNAYYRFIADNLRPIKKSVGLLSDKTVEVKIYIDKTGKIAFAEIEKGIDETHNTAVLDMVKAMPNWLPALQNNRPVPTALLLPILFVD